MSRLVPLAATMLCLALTGCRQDDAPTYRPAFADRPPAREPLYVFGVHPLHNPQRLSAVYTPLMDHLSAKIPHARFELDASRGYPAYDKKLAERRHHFSLPNPYQTLRALKRGYHVIAKQSDDAAFRGIILVRKDSGVRTVRDLVGKAVSFPAPTALAATMMPQHYLQTHGLDLRTQVETRYVGSQESSIMNVYLGKVAAGATWPPPWAALKAERPELAEALEVRWQTEPLINNGVVARDDVPAEVVAQVRDVLVHLHEHAEGQALLSQMTQPGFEAADDDRYRVVEAFLAEFQREVRRLE